MTARRHHLLGWSVAAVLAITAAPAHAQRPAPDVVPAAGGGITIAPVTHATLQIRQGATVILVDPARFTPGAPLPFTPQARRSCPSSRQASRRAIRISMWPVTPGQLARFDGLPAPTIILVTDEHDDHLDPKAIEALQDAGHDRGGSGRRSPRGCRARS